MNRIVLNFSFKPKIHSIHAIDMDPYNVILPYSQAKLNVVKRTGAADKLPQFYLLYLLFRRLVYSTLFFYHRCLSLPSMGHWLMKMMWIMFEVTHIASSHAPHYMRRHIAIE